METAMVLQDLTKYVTSAGSHPSGDGQQMVLRFPNGYGASIVRTLFSYGSREGKFELAVAKWTGEGNDDFVLDYNTPVTNGVLGWLTAKEVLDTLYEILALQPGEAK